MRWASGIFSEPWKAAGKCLTELLEKWNLNPATYHETVRMLLDVHLELGPPAQIVRYFEIVVEKWPDEEIPFAKILKVGAAYHNMGEYRAKLSGLSGDGREQLPPR